MGEYVIQKSPAGIITGFAPDKWMVNNAPIYDYKPCCLKPKNWLGEGEWQDFKYTNGRHRNVECGVCHARIYAADEWATPAEAA